MNRLQQKIINSVFYKRVAQIYSLHYEFDDFNIFPDSEVADVYYKGVLVEKMPINEFNEAINYRNSCYEKAVKEEWSKL